MKIDYDYAGLEGKPGAPENCRGCADGAPFPMAPSSGISTADAKRGFLTAPALDPNYPKEPNPHRVSGFRRDFTRPDWYGQGDPHAERIAKTYREMGMTPPDDLVRKEGGR